MSKYTSESYIRKLASHYNSIMLFCEDKEGNPVSYIQGEGTHLTAHFLQAIREQEGILPLIIAALMIAREQSKDVKDYIDAVARAFLEDNLPKDNEDLPYSEEEDED